MNAFDYVTAASYSKKDLIRDSDNPELAEASYVPFLTNRAFSYHADAVLYANEMNMRPHVDNLLAFDYYLNSLRPQKRFSKWEKKEENGDLEIVKEYYQYSYEKASRVLSLLSEDQLIELRRRIQKGGQ